MDCKIVERITKDLFYTIKDRFSFLLDNYRITNMDRVSPRVGPEDVNYIRIYFKKKDVAIYLSRATVTKTKNTIRDIFADSIIWIEDSMTQDDIWVLLRDIDHKKSWTSIK